MFSLEVPEWANGATISVNGQTLAATLTPGTFARIDRLWKKDDLVEFTLPMQPRLSVGDRDDRVPLGPRPFAANETLNGAPVKLHVKAHRLNT